MNTRTVTLRERLVGAWKLVSFIETDVKTNATSYPMGKNPNGLIIYTPDGYMSAQLQEPGASNFSSADLFRGTPEEYADAAHRYIAYSGRFFVDEDQNLLRHEMAVSLFPNWLGQKQVRLAKLDGDTLQLAPDEPQFFNGSLRTALLLWKRAPTN